MKVGLATGNPGKVREIAQIVAPAGIELVPPPPGWPAPPETEDTYVGNARTKATALVEALGIPCLADDSGIEADALHGAPGVRSARFSAEGTDDANLVEERRAEREVDGGAAEHALAAAVRRPHCIERD